MQSDPPTLGGLLTPQFDISSIFAATALASLVLYLLGVRALRRRGMRWAWYRTANFTAGILTVLLVTATQVMSYSMTVFSVHMLQKMILTVVSAMLIMLGAPISLAIRALPRHGPGALGRKVLLGFLRSRPTRVLAHPVATTTLFVGGLYGIYFTPLFDVLMRNWVGNVVMLVFFLGTGLLAFGGAFALGPWPHRASAPVRLIELLAPGPLHAFFAVALMLASRPLVQTFASPPARWDIDVMTDQLAAGNIIWGFGELPTIAAVAIIYVQWVRSEGRRAPAADRRAEVDLVAYNAHLARLAATPRR